MGNNSEAYTRLLARLKKARLANDLTQAEVAAKIMKPQSYISKLESGERRLDVIELAQLAKIYGWPLDDFISDDESQSQ